MELPEKNVSSWHQNLLARALSVGKLAVDITAETDLDGKRMVCQLLDRPALRTCFGAPAQDTPLPPRTKLELWDEWLLHLWGRRCFRYLTALINGLKACQKIKPSPDNSTEITNLVLGLELVSSALRSIFISSNNPRNTPSSSLKERQDIANFHITYIDPVLFSALHILHDPHISSWDSSTKRTLWKSVKSELIKHTKNGTGKSDHIGDEATTWWGITSLIREEKDRFCLSEADQIRGYQRAAEVCVNLAQATDGKVSFPSADDVWTEATPEIYGETRTRLLIAKNCADVIGLLRSQVKPESLAPLEEYLVEHFLFVIGKGNDQIQQHIALLGFALETSSAILQLIHSAKSKKSAASSQNPPAPTPTFTLALSRRTRTVVLNGHQLRLGPSYYFLLRALAENLKAGCRDITFKEFNKHLIDVMSDPSLESLSDHNSTKTLETLKEQFEKSETRCISHLIRGFKDFLLKQDRSVTDPLIEALPQRAPCTLQLESTQVKLTNS